MLTTVGGICLILLGIVGLFLPILQGILLIIAGLGLLSIGNERVRDWVGRLKKKYGWGESGFRGMKTNFFSRKRSIENPENGGVRKESE
ncbi:MAG: hypothetical protein GTN81_16515 [Proteobacteria bacterium]|nr:hypothetical protein [Pseudomonadota bacterium]